MERERENRVSDDLLLDFLYWMANISSAPILILFFFIHLSSHYLKTLIDVHSVCARPFLLVKDKQTGNDCMIDLHLWLQISAYTSRCDNQKRMKFFSSKEKRSTTRILMILDTKTSWRLIFVDKKKNISACSFFF